MKYILTALLFCYFAKIQAQDSTATQQNPIPKGYITSQYAGSFGRLSIGLGTYILQDKFQVSILYGYTPNRNESTSIHTIGFKGLVTIKDFDLKEGYWLSPYAGFGITYSGEMPMPFPIFAGVEFRKINLSKQHSIYNGISIFGEFGTNGMWLTYKMNNETLPLDELFSLALGLKVIFKHPNR